MNGIDVRGKLFGFLFRQILTLDGMVSTAFARVVCMAWGIELGRGVRFYGPSRLRRFPGAVMRIGAGCRIDSSAYKNSVGLKSRSILTALPGACLEIGEGTGLSGGVIYARLQIRIGKNVKIGANALIMDHDDHPEDPRSGVPRPIVIEDDVWLGANCVVLKGVTIGRGALVGANSVVTKDIPANGVAIGTAAKVVRVIPT
jgi:acetyltransferase-like isoleucine patch superfamily enzyme